LVDKFKQQISTFKAVNEGVNLIEFDIGLTKDNVPVLMHDDTMDRTTNMNGPLRRRMFADLVNCNCAAKFTKYLSKDTIESRFIIEN
jgi:glycerophosphoryl diester phosphodiesterase